MVAKKQVKPRYISETKFKEMVKKFLESVGVYEAGTPIQDITTEIKGWYFKHWGGGYSKAGICDLICCVNGIFIAPELKSSTGSADELQKRNIIMINKGNGVGMVLYPEGFEEFKKIIKGVINCNTHIPELNALKSANSSTKCIIMTK